MKVLVGWSIWYGTRNVEEELAKTLENGFDYLEISLAYPWISNEENLVHIISVAKDLGFKVAFHGPWRDVRLGSPYREISESSRAIVSKAIGSIVKHEPEYFNVHIISEEITFSEKVKDKVLNEAKKSLNMLQRVSEDTGITITVENNPQGFFSLPSHFNFIENYDSIYFCLDVGHAIISYFNIGEKNFDPISVAKEWISVIGSDKILVTHLHNIIQSGKVLLDHYFFGYGIVNLSTLCRFLCRKTNVRYVLLELFHREENIKHISERETVEIIRRNCIRPR